MLARGQRMVYTLLQVILTDLSAWIRYESRHLPPSSRKRLTVDGTPLIRSGRPFVAAR